MDLSRVEQNMWALTEANFLYIVPAFLITRLLHSIAKEWSAEKRNASAIAFDVAGILVLLWLLYSSTARPNMPNY